MVNWITGFRRCSAGFVQDSENTVPTWGRWYFENSCSTGTGRAEQISSKIFVSPTQVGKKIICDRSSRNIDYVAHSIMLESDSHINVIWNNCSLKQCWVKIYLDNMNAELEIFI